MKEMKIVFATLKYEFAAAEISGFFIKLQKWVRWLNVNWSKPQSEKVSNQNYFSVCFNNKSTCDEKNMFWDSPQNLILHLDPCKTDNVDLIFEIIAYFLQILNNFLSFIEARSKFT